jgi:hypothetical protein
MILMLGTLAFVFFFNFLFKERIINLYEKNLENPNKLSAKNKNKVWIIFGLLPVLFFINIYLIRSLINVSSI